MDDGPRPGSRAGGDRDGLIVLVTGASGALGRMISTELARAGHRVFASMRSLEGRHADEAREYRALAMREDLDLTPIRLDVTSEESVDTAVLHVMEESGFVDVVVHAAGHMSFGPTEAFTPEQLVELYDVNAVGAHRVSRAVLPSMRKRGSGLLVWIAAYRGNGQGAPCSGPHFAAKAAMEQLAISYAAEIGRFGVETSIVLPGTSASDERRFEHAEKPDDDAVVRSYVEGQATAPLGDGREAMGRSEPDAAAASAADVARAIRRVVETPTGARPLRIDVDPSQAASGVDDCALDILRAAGPGNVCVAVPSQRPSRGCEEH